METSIVQVRPRILSSDDWAKGVKRFSSANISDPYFSGTSYLWSPVVQAGYDPKVAPESTNPGEWNELHIICVTAIRGAKIFPAYRRRKTVRFIRRIPFFHIKKPKVYFNVSKKSIEIESGESIVFAMRKGPASVDLAVVGTNEITDIYVSKIQHGRLTDDYTLELAGPVGQGLGEIDLF